MATILVVDDEPGIRQLTAFMLEHEGFSVRTAANGAEALDVWHSHAGGFDVLLSDVMMPGMDGLTLATTLRAIAPNLPVILMSGTWDTEQVDCGGPVYLLPKPFSFSSLLQLVRKAAELEDAGEPLRCGAEFETV